LRLECFHPSILKPASRPVTSHQTQMLSCTSPNPPLRAQRAPARAGSFTGPNAKWRGVRYSVAIGGKAEDHMLNASSPSGHSANCFRGRDASYLAPPAQIRTCGFPAYGSHLGYRRQFDAVDEPTSCVTLTRLGVRRVLSWRAFPSVPALRSTNSAADRSALFVGFTATTAWSDFSCPYIIGYGSSPSRCGPSRSRDI
jgi:hypothetical protein